MEGKLIVTFKEAEVDSSILEKKIQFIKNIPLDRTTYGKNKLFIEVLGKKGEDVFIFPETEISEYTGLEKIKDCKIISWAPDDKDGANFLRITDSLNEKYYFHYSPKEKQGNSK